MDLAIDKAGPGHRSLPELGLKPITNIADSRVALARRRCGRIVIEAGSLVAVYGRWWSHWGSLLEVRWDQRFRRYPKDRCELFYQSPLGSSKFLTLSYVRSGPRTSLTTFYAATLVLDEIAWLKDSNAIVCHVTNARISDRLMERWGWQTHCEHWKGRHFIKRLYGEHAPIKACWRRRLRLGTRETNS